MTNADDSQPFFHHFSADELCRYLMLRGACVHLMRRHLENSGITIMSFYWQNCEHAITITCNAITCNSFLSFLDIYPIVLVILFTYTLLTIIALYVACKNFPI